MKNFTFSARFYNYICNLLNLKFLALYLLFVGGVSGGVFAQPTSVFWRNDGSNGNWEWGSTCDSWGSDGNWNYPTWTGNRRRPDCYGNHILTIDGNGWTSMNLNSSTDFGVNRIFFGSGSTSNRTISTDAGRTLFLNANSGDPKIENNSTGTHTFSIPITFNNWTEINPVNGDLSFTGNINMNGQNLNIWGNNSKLLSFSGILSGTNSKVILNQNSKVLLTASNTYTGNTEINAGELWIGTGGDISSSSSIFLGNGGAQATVAKFWLSDASGGTTFTRNITVNLGNSTTRYIGGLNTSGTHTFSGNITNNSSGGLYLSAELAGGTTAFSGVISGSNPVLTSGAGTVVISGTSANTYTGATTIGATTILNKSANVIAIPSATTINNGITLRTDAANQWGTGTPPLVTINGNGVLNLNNNNQKIALASSSSTASVSLGSGTLNIDNTGTDTYAGGISGSGGITKTNTGIQILTNTSLSYTGATTITAGEIRLQPTANATFASQVVLNGGTMSTTGIATTSTWTSSSTLNLTANSTIALASGTAHTLIFANSSAINWTAGTVLTITGWSGTIGSGGTNGKIFIGSTSSGLTSAQLAQIIFTGFGGAMQLSTGEIVPNGVIVWANTGASTAWYTAGNWNPSTASGGWLTSNIAQFQNAGTATTAGINMNTASLSIGSIEVTSARTRALTIGNSSATSGTLTLNGSTVNSTSNLIVRNNSNSLLTIQDNETGTGKTMGVVLGNATNNIINIDGTGDITISSIISGSNRNITKGGAGSGILTLSGANIYTGTTTISSGTLRLGATNAIPVGNPGGGVTLSGGTLSTGATSGFSAGTSSTNNMGTLTLTASSTIALGTGSHSLYFSAASFTAGQTLTITGWAGTPGATGSAGKIYIGNSASLSSAQLAQITFSGVAGIAIQLGTGEIVPTSSYYSKSTGSLNDLSTWGTNTDGTGIAPANFSSNGITYNIRNNATPTIGASWTVSGTGSKVVVGDGTNACNFTVPSNFIVTSPTTEVSNNGTITRTTSGGNSWGTLAFASGAKYVHNVNGGTIPTATWDANSTLQVNGLTNGTMAGLNQSFGNVSWDCSGQTVGVHLGASFTIQSGAIFTLVATNTGSVSILNDAASSSSVSASWAGNLRIDGGLFNILRANNNSSNHDASLIVNNLTVTGGTLNINNYSSTSYYPDGYLTINGNLSLSGGVIDLMTVASTSSNSIGNLTLLGDFTWSGGTLKRTNSSANPYTTFDFTKTSGTQIFTQTLGSTTYTSSGRGITWSENGASLVDINYEGTSGTANNLTSPSGNVNVNCSSTCTYATALTIASGKSLTIGSTSPANSTARLDMGANTLTLTGSTSTVHGFLRSAGTFTDATTSTLTFSSTGTYEHNLNAGTIPTATWSNGSTCSIIGTTSTAPSGLGQTFSNFSWNCSSQTGNLNLTGGLTSINGNFNLLSTNTGSLRFTGNTALTMNIGGNFNVDGGTLYFVTGSSAATINISGNLSISAGTLDINNGGSGSQSINIGGNFSQSGGTFTRTSGSAAVIIFNKSSGIQNINQSAGSISGTNNWTIGTGSTSNTLELASNVNLGSGTGTLTISNGSALDLKGYTLSGSFGATINGTGVSNSGAFYTSTGSPSFARPITLGTSALIKSSGTSLTLTGGVISAASKNLTIDGTGSTTFSTAAISGAGSVIKNGAGNLTYSFANTYTGSTTLNAGTLTLNAANAIAVASTGGGVVLNGGTLSSGSSSGNTVGTSSSNMGTLTLTENTALSLGTGAHSLYFAASDAVGWTNGKILTITGWTGNDGESGTAGKLFVGGGSSGLLASQLSKITINGKDVVQLGSGEIVPRGTFYRSAQSGNWNETSTWERSLDGGATWVGAVATPTSSDGTITILDGHNVVVTASVSVDELTINSGGTLTINASQTLTIANGAGTDLSLSGTLIVNGTLSNSGQIAVNNGGYYNHANGTSIPSNITFVSGSSLEISGSATASNIHTYNNRPHHLIWSSSGTMPVSFTTGSLAQTLCNGDFTLSNGTYVMATSGSSNISTLTIGGNVVLSGGTLEINNSNGTTGLGEMQFKVLGNYTQTSGVLDLDNSAYDAAAGVYVSGNFTHTGGTIKNTSNGSRQKIYLNGTSGTQSLESIGQSNIVKFEVAGSNAQCVVEAGKTFVLGSGGLTIGNGTSNPDMLVNGTYRAASATTTDGNLSFSGTGTYEHNLNAGTIPTAIWSSGSNCSIIGNTGGTPAGLGQSFHNFTWNSPSMTGSANLSGGLTTVNGTLSIVSTGSPTVRELRLATSNGTAFTASYGAINISGGTLALIGSSTAGSNTSTVAVLGNVSISGSGILELNGGANAGSTTLNIAGDLNTSGTSIIKKSFSATGTITFNKSSGSQTFTQSAGTISNAINWNVGTGSSTNTLELASNVNLGTGSGTFTVLGNATLDTKAFVLSGSNAFTTNSGSNVITANADGINGSISSTGNKTLNGNMNYTFNGSSAQVTGSLLTNANNITISNSAGVTMSTNATVTGNLTLTSGKLSLGSTTLTLSNDVSGGNSGSYIVAYDNNGTIGKVKQAIPVVKQYIFPIGDPSVYTPVTVTFNTGTSLSSGFLEVYTKPSKVTGMASTVQTVLNRSWVVEPTGITTPNYDIRYTYGSGEVSGDLGQELVPVKFSVDTWYKPENSVLPNGTAQGNATNINTLPSNTLEWKGLSTFSEFGGAGGSSPLPVELTSFSASCEEDIVTLSWSTASEQNSSHFDVEKSTDGENWRVIGTILAAGNSTQEINYSFIDSEKSSGDNYYRLNQVDIDGKNEYFGPITVSCEEDAKITTYPNPSKGEFNLVMHAKTNEKVTLKITDGNSRVISTKVLDLQNGINLFPIRENLSSGVYHIQLTSESGKTTVLKHSVY